MQDTLGNMHAPWETPGKSCCLPPCQAPEGGGSGEGDVVFPPVKPPKGGSGEEEMLPQVIPPSMQETLGNITLDITLGYIQP